MLSEHEILSRFSPYNPKPDGKGYRCQCPKCGRAKDNPPLHIEFDSGKFLATCFCGCAFNEIIESVGLSMSDVGESDIKQAPSLWERLEFGCIQAHGEGKLTAIYDYSNEFGVYQYSKLRFEKASGGKITPYRRIDYKTETYDSGIGDKKHILYRLPEFLKAVRSGETVYFVEGEKDVETLRKIGLIATTCGSSGGWKKEFARYFTGAKLVILPDNDEPGKKLASQVFWGVALYAYWRQITPTSKEKGGDVTDWLMKEGGSIEKLSDLVDAGDRYETRRYAEWLVVDKEYGYETENGETYKDPPPDGRPCKKVVTNIKSIKANTDKLADVFQKGNNFLIVRNPMDEKDDFYFYEPSYGFYKRLNGNGVKGKIKAYMPLGTAGTQGINNTYQLLMCGSSFEHISKHSELDANNRYINLKNGLYDLKDKKLIDHSPSLKSTIQLNCEYKPGAQCPEFMKYINTLCSDQDGNIDQQKINVIQEFMGLFVSNIDIAQVKKMLILYSQIGDTGKSVLLFVIEALLGMDKIANIPLQDMNEKSKFTMGSLFGRRMICVGDQPGTDIDDSGILKQLTGGDTVKMEQKGKQPIYMKYRGGIAICCNVLPHIKGDKGEHLYKRFMIIPCEHHIPENEQDKNLRSKIAKELDGVFIWSMEGLHRLVNNGMRFSECQSADNTLKDYRELTDSLYRFIQVNEFTITGSSSDKVLARRFYDVYVKWCDDEKVNAISKGNFKDRMISLGCRHKKTNYDADNRNVWCYLGLKKADISL